MDGPSPSSDDVLGPAFCAGLFLWETDRTEMEYEGTTKQRTLRGYDKVGKVPRGTGMLPGVPRNRIYLGSTR